MIIDGRLSLLVIQFTLSFLPQTPSSIIHLSYSQTALLLSPHLGPLGQHGIHHVPIRPPVNLHLQNPGGLNRLLLRLQLVHVPVRTQVLALEEAGVFADEPDEEVGW